MTRLTFLSVNMTTTRKKLSVILSRQGHRKKVNGMQGPNTSLTMKIHEKSSVHILSKSFLKDRAGKDMNQICLLAQD